MMKARMGEGAINQLALLRYGDQWRLSRRIVHQGLNHNVVSNYEGVQLMHTK